jgi:hypothetical protein
VDRRVATALVCALLLTGAACNRPAAAPPQPAQPGAAPPGASLGASPDAGVTGGGGAMPSGAIVAFSGQVPPGWTVCDGRMTPSGRPTPDLRGRFVFGADPNTGDAGQSGGSATHTHQATATVGRGTGGVDKDNDFYAATANHTHPVDVKPADSLPPYVKLIYAMKD